MQQIGPPGKDLRNPDLCIRCWNLALLTADCLFFFWQMSPILYAFFHHGWRGVYLLPAPIHALYVTSTVKTPIKYPEKFCDLSNNLHQAQHLKAMYAELASLLTSMVKHIGASVEAQGQSKRVLYSHWSSASSETHFRLHISEIMQTYFISLYMLCFFLYSQCRLFNTLVKFCHQNHMLQMK